MRFLFFSDTAKGVMLGLLTFMLTFSSIPIHVATAANQPLFSMTLEAPTNNPTRRQWASIIQNSFSSANINTNLVFVSFTQLLAFLLGCSNGCPAKTFAQGGWDAGFVGNGGGTVLPDFGTQNVIFYKNEGPNDIPPVGSNYYFWKNSTFNSLADQYGLTFDKTQALAIAQKMVQIATQERPGLIIDYPTNVYAYSPNFIPWSATQAPAVTSTTAGLDWAHWKTSADATINVGSTGPLDAANPLPTAAQNSFYDRLIYGSIQAGTGTEEADSRGAGVYFNALATSITSSSDHLTWTEKVLPHNFQDGVAVNANDYIFTVMSQLRLDVGWVGLGTITSQLGIKDQFTFKNGTTRYVSNGTYFTTQPAGWTPTSSWTYVDDNTFSFTMPAAYIFTDPLVTLVSPIPMHIYEKVPAKTWSSSFLSGFNAQGALTNTPTTVTWDTSKYGGSGTYQTFGPVGDGAYIYQGYDTTSQTGTLTRFDGYWNASGLKSLGEFTIKTIHVVHVQEKQAAIAAFGSGTLNYLDSNYNFNANDVSTLNGLGAKVAKVEDPANGWQEMVLNDQAPIWGTGTGTPLGQQNPSQAAFAARMVRKALSYLVPRQYIVDNLLQGLAAPGITEFFPTAGIIHAGDIYNGITADPYNPHAALSYLAAAGYSTGVPAGVGGGFSFPPIQPITIGGVSITPPDFLLGNSLTFSGSFKADPIVAATHGGFAVILQQSTNSGTSWSPVTFTLTSPSSTAYTISYSPATTGKLEYRVLFTGIGADFVKTGGYNNATIIQSQLDVAYGGSVNPKAPRAVLVNATTPQFGPTTTLNVGTLADVVSALVQAQGAQLTSAANQLTAQLNTLQTNTQDALNTLQGNVAKPADVTALQSSLNSQIGTLTDVSYAALAVAIVLGLLAIVLSRRKHM
jgi:ABC-type transport system substrate-binding protein